VDTHGLGRPAKQRNAEPLPALPIGQQQRKVLVRLAVQEVVMTHRH
jgi:hypothetical protein